jgi:hypothetical protein
LKVHLNERFVDHHRSLGRASRRMIDVVAVSENRLPMRICTAKPDRPPAMAASIIFRRSATIDLSRRAFERSNCPRKGLCLCISFLLGRNPCDQLSEASKAEVMIAPSPEPPQFPGQKQRPATALGTSGHLPPLLKLPDRLSPAALLVPSPAAHQALGLGVQFVIFVESLPGKPARVTLPGTIASLDSQRAAPRAFRQILRNDDPAH